MAPTVSRAASGPLKAAQDAMEAEKWDDALRHLKEVEALTDRNPYDTHLMSEMLGFVYVNTDQYAQAVGLLEAGLTSGFLDEAERPKRMRALSQLYYQVKDYDKAIEYGRRAIDSGAASDDMYTLVAQSYYFKGDVPTLRSFTESYIDGQIAENRAPTEHSMQLLLDACIRQEDKECQMRTLRHLVTYHPKTDYWQNLLYSLLQSEGHSDRSLLHVYRLMLEVDVIRRPEDYAEMAQLAVEQGSPGEAQRILEAALAKDLFADQKSRQRGQRLLESAKRQAATDRSVLPQIEKDAAAAKTGTGDAGVGLAYFSYQEYDKAEAYLKRGLSKGGLRNEADARLLLGIVQIEAGKRDEAVQTFATVKGHPILEEVAALWSVYTKRT